jgi:hypothetical protein
LVAIGTFAFLQKTGKLAEYKINMFSSIGTDEISFDKEPEPADNNKDLSIGIVEGTEEDSKVEEKTEDLSIETDCDKWKENQQDTGNEIPDEF